MSKIWRMKRWLHLEQAAEYIAMLSDEHSVSVADLLQLALEYKLQISTIFPNGVLACVCREIDDEAIKYNEVPSLDGERMLHIPVGGPIFYAPNGRAMQAEPKVIWLDNDEPYDLVMLGGEHGDIEHRFWELTGGAREETTNIQGTWVRHVGTYFQLMGVLPRKKGENTEYYPIGGLPEDAVLVLRQAEIRRFVELLASGDATERGAAPAPTPTPAPRWPWGNHNTTMLNKLEAAARRFWLNVDPLDNTTAPTNEAVAAWLSEQGVSKRMADAMASILRPDGLPTGPRTSS